MTRLLTFLWIGLLVGALLAPVPAHAQQCDTLFETITTLRPPTFGFPTVWDAEYGARDGMTQIKSGVPIEGGTVFAIGRHLSPADFKPEKIFLVELNRRGRALREESRPAAEGEDPIKMIRNGAGFIAVSNMRGGTGKTEKWARLSWYDGQGKYRREKILKDSVFDYEAMSLVPAVEKSGFIAVLHAVNRNDEKDQNGVLMRFSESGDLLWRRAYRPGISNMLYNIVPAAETDYIATGMIRVDDGRMAGWAMKLGHDGAIHWQRTYARGAFAALHHAALSASATAEGKGFILTGESKPIDGGPEAAWVMAINALGDPLWQRYYRRTKDYALTGKWAQSEPDGRVTMIAQARAAEGEGGMDHVRMLTLSPRGILLQDEGYYEGLGATAFDYAPGWNEERIIMTTIEDDMNEEEKEDDSPITVIGLAADQPAQETEQTAAPPPAHNHAAHRGWVFVASALDPYADICILRRNR